MQSGIEVPEGKDFTLDLNGHRIRGIAPFVGAEGYENCFRFFKDSNITIKNGTLDTIAPTAAILIQNYANLTLDNVQLKGKASTQYILSNNFGNVVLKNGTSINSSGGHISFDAHYGLSAEYDDGVTVTIEDDTVVVSGPIEYTKDDRITDIAQFYEKAHIYIPIGYTGVTAPDGFEFKPTEDGSKQELVPVTADK